MVLLTRKRKQQRIYKRIQSPVLGWWKKEISLSVYDFKDYAEVTINQADLRPSRCPLDQGCQRRGAKIHFARRSHCDVAQSHIEEF